MTKKHFVWAAKLVKDHLTAGRIETARALALAFSDMFRAFGPNFDKARFLDACGMGD